MIINIATITIEIDDTLLCEKTIYQLMPFSFIEPHLNSEIAFRIINSKDKSFLKNFSSITRLDSLQYQESGSEIVVYDHFSCFKIDTKNRYMLIYPKYQTEVDFITDLKLLFSLIVLEYGGLLLHSSAVFKNNNAIVFTGQSGAGKSTISELMGLSWKMLNDDFNVLLPHNNKIKIYSTPFGKLIGECGSSPFVTSIFFISKSILNKINSLPEKTIVLNLFKNTCNFPSTDALATKLFENIQYVKDHVFIGELLFAKDFSLIDFFESNFMTGIPICSTTN